MKRGCLSRAGRSRRTTVSSAPAQEVMTKGGKQAEPVTYSPSSFLNFLSIKSNQSKRETSATSEHRRSTHFIPDVDVHLCAIKQSEEEINPYRGGAVDLHRFTGSGKSSRNSLHGQRLLLLQLCCLRLPDKNKTFGFFSTGVGTYYILILERKRTLLPPGGHGSLQSHSHCHRLLFLTLLGQRGRG